MGDTVGEELWLMLPLALADAPNDSDAEGEGVGDVEGVPVAEALALGSTYAQVRLKAPESAP